VKTAVCLSGQARFIGQNSSNLLGNLILPAEADVFCHFWDTSGENLEPYKAVDVFRPVDCLLEPQKVFNEDAQRFIRPKYKPNLWRYQTVHSMYYSVWQANLLKQEYEQRQGFLYDCVIRSRTDIAFDRVFNFAEFETNREAVWLRQYGESPAGKSCSDLFAFSNSGQMDMYAGCFNHLPDLLEEGGHLFAETILHSYLRPRCTIALSKMGYEIVRD
jgi:hypothetical protein